MVRRISLLLKLEEPLLRLDVIKSRKVTVVFNPGDNDERVNESH